LRREQENALLTRLLVLWLLAEQPHHGYSIRKILSDAGLGFWFPIEDASIYSMLRGLVKAGLARELRSEREGRRPRRTLYAITPKGREQYADLLRRAWRETDSVTDPVQVAFAAHGDLPDREVEQLARERTEALQARLERIAELRTAAPAVEMADRETARVSAELKWLQGWRATRKGRP
jgi:DNA-binding PadR family transcriptional regulator